MKKFLLASGVLLVCLVAYQYLTLPDVSSLRKENPQITALMRQREQEARAAGKKARRSQLWTGYATISARLRSAVLIGEDDAFYQHEGYDLDQIKESFARNWEKKGLVRGGNHRGVGRQAQIVVGAQIQHVAGRSVGCHGEDVGALRRGDDPFCLVHAGLTDAL